MNIGVCSNKVIFSKKLKDVLYLAWEVVNSKEIWLNKYTDILIE